MVVRQLRLICTSSIRNALRSGSGIVYVVVSITLGLVISHWPIQLIDVLLRQKHGDLTGAPGKQDALRKAIIDDLVDQLGDGAAKMLGAIDVTGTDEEELKEWSSYLLDERPAVLSVSLGFLYILLPFFIVIGTFNLVSGDVQHRGLRFLLLRTSRFHIYFGRYLGALIFTVLVMALLVTAVVAFVGLKFSIYEWGELTSWAMRGLVGVLCLAMPFAAFCLMISAWIDSPFGSLIICYLAIFSVPAVTLIMRAAYEPAGYFMFAMPWGVAPAFLRPNPIWSVLGAIGCVGYTAVFLGIGYWNFRRRDL